MNNLVELIAHVCHDANRAYALATGEPVEQLHGPWTEAPEAIKESARVGVRHALDGAGPEQLHESWCATKLADGWVYGPERDNDAKVHPCLVPYVELPVRQQTKDTLFAAIVDALA
jgi:hypothetical protein